MKKILIVGILVAIVLVSIGLVTAGNLLGTGNVISDSNKECKYICDGQGNCTCDGRCNCTYGGQCNIGQCCNQYMNSKCLINNNSNGCCKKN
ncbi:MAG: hypothetical protein MUO82_07245 [Candidatus Thermoplasmatota archaeon]|nr:hypothetical protein [Candidatus Thermoplasmatota archaeon]